MKKFSRFLAGLFIASFWSVAAFAQGNFIRGDANCDGTVNSADVSAVNNCIFFGPCPCRDAADVNDDGVLSSVDAAYLLNYLNSAGPPPRLPFPDCGADPTADGLSCVSSCCTANNHYQAWRVFDLGPPVFRTVSAVDQFMQDNQLRLDTIQFLSNPAQKDTFRIIDPDDHLTWYRARGRDTLLEVEFVNQFQRDTILIDSVRYFLVPTQKQPHPPYDSLDHYKAYHIRNPQAFNRMTFIGDQFLGASVSSMIPRYFLTPARKNFDPTYDMATHYVAYEFFPKRTLFSTWQTVDQFGSHNLRADSSMLLLVPTMKLSVRAPSFECSDGIDNDGDGLIDFPADCGCADATDPTEAPNPPTQCSDGVDNDGDGLIDLADPDCANICDNLEGVPPPDTGDNHYKTWSIQTLTFTGTAQVKDQFKTEQLQLQFIFALSNPVQKVFAGDTSQIFDPDDHLLWYSARGQRTVLEVDYVNQFESTTVRIDTVLALLVPATKQPHPPYDNLDHYKAYRIAGTLPIINLPVQLQDQFDLTPEQITSLRPAYFLTPAQKNVEPVYDTLTHYVGYLISPIRSAPQTRTVIDQFGTHIVNIQNSQVLLVPTRKLAYRLPECGDGLDNDGDGFVDYPADCGCTSAADFTESPNPSTACSDGIDNDGDGLIDLADPDCADICDGVEGVSQPHYKTWSLLSVPFTGTAQVRDQFMTENLQLTSINYLSNPTLKVVSGDSFKIVDPDDHLLWYRSSSPGISLRVDYVNQFESTSVAIGSVSYFLVPAQKLPHPLYDSLDHYKAYNIQGGVSFSLPVQLQDQFDVTPEQITSLFPAFFLTPAQKNAEPVYDTVTHYVAYAISPIRSAPQTRTVIDQFGTRNVNVQFSQFLLVPTRKVKVRPPDCSDGLDNDGDGLIDYPADCGCFGPTDFSEAPNPITQCSNGIDDDGDGLIDLADCGCTDPCDFTESPNPPTQCSDGLDNDGDGFIDLADSDCDNICDTSEVGEVSPILNHYKTWRTVPMPFQTTVTLTDQFIPNDVVRLDTIDFLSNPARKVTPQGATEILRPNDHLTWYGAMGRGFPREIHFRNQFGEDTAVIDTLDYLLVPTQKLPHNPPVQLDHYKCYRIRLPQPFSLPISLQDQFDPTPEFMNTLTPVYFCTPCRKNSEPVYDTVTHYVGYFFDPQPRSISPRVTIDQFGQRELIPRQSELLLVPSDKTFVCPCAKGDVNCDGELSPADVVCMLNCVFLGGAPAPCVCDPCVTDVDCNDALSPADVVLELNRVFLNNTAPPWCGS